MKNFTGYKTQKSVLKTVDEPPNKKKFNWDRLLFLIAFFLIVSYVSYNLFYKYAYETVNGQVILGKMAVHFTDDVRLKKLNIVSGDSILIGDTLFTYSYEEMTKLDDQTQSIHLQAKIGTSGNWYLKEKLNTKRQIAIKKSKLAGEKAKLTAKKLELEQQQKQILMGVDVAHKIPPLQSKIIDIHGDINVFRLEIKALKKYLSALRKQEKEAKKLAEEELNAQQSAAASFTNATYHYVSPISGLVGQINKHDNEVCYRTEDIMVIHQLESLKIKAFLSQKTFQNFKLNDLVQITFPDGTSSRGKITNFYISTEALPPEFQNKHEPTERSIIADIVPTDMIEAQHWTSYYKMTVKVTKKKY